MKTMNYMLLIYQEGWKDENAAENKTFDECLAMCGGMVERLQAKGQYVGAGILQPTPYATSLRLRDGRRLVTDGPFAETREGLAGYLLIEAANLDEAIAIAAEHPVAEYGTVEVRPLLASPDWLARGTSPATQEAVRR